MTSRDPARLRQGLLPLTTTPGIYNNHLSTPISAVSMTSSHYHSAAQTPGSSIQPSNPQEWAPTQAAVAERAVQYAGEVQGKWLTRSVNFVLGILTCASIANASTTI